MEKIKLFPYKKTLPKIFQKEKEKFLKILPGCEIHHIGSSTIPGVGGKGIVDILIAFSNQKQAKGLIDKLEEYGYMHVFRSKRGRIFLTKKWPTTYGDIHLHLVERGSKVYKESLVFRDFLRMHKEEIMRYCILKKKWLKNVKGDRIKYTKMKSSYIRNILKKSNGISLS